MANSYLGLAAFCLPTPKIASTRRPYPLHKSPSVGPAALRMTPDTKPLKIEPRPRILAAPLACTPPFSHSEICAVCLMMPNSFAISLSFSRGYSENTTIPRHFIPMPKFLIESSYYSFIAQCMSLPPESSLCSTQLHGLCSSSSFKELCFPITVPKHCRLSVFSFP